MLVDFARYSSKIDQSGDAARRGHRAPADPGRL
jgi:hypothetical protein